MGKLTIVPFVNTKGQNRYKVVGANGNTFLDAFGYGYLTHHTAYSGIKLFSQRKNNKKCPVQIVRK